MISTLEEMSGLMNATSGDKHVTTITLDDFENDFDGTVTLIVDVLLGSKDARGFGMVQKAAVCDPKRNPASDGHHASSEECTSAAFKAIDQSKDKVWETVRALSHELGFVE